MSSYPVRKKSQALVMRVNVILIVQIHFRSEFRAPRRAELLESGADMVFDRSFADRKCAGDRFVRFPERDKPHHFAFTLGQIDGAAAASSFALSDARSYESSVRRPSW
jgi:hypothetical protein